MTAVRAALPGVVGAPVAGPVVVRHAAASIWWRRLLRLSSVLAAIGVWQLLTVNDVRVWARFDTLPTVTEIVAVFAERLRTDQYWLDLGQSLIRILTGFGLAAVAGVVTGIMLGRSKVFADTFGSLTELARPIPRSRWCPSRSCCFPPTRPGSCSSRSWRRTSPSW